MKTLKRLFCILTLFCLVSFPMTSFAEEYDYTKEINFLNKIGISNVNSAVVNSEASRAEAAVYIAQALNHREKSSEAVQIFLDVDSSHTAFSSVWYLKSIGALSYSSDNLFRPDDTMTHNELFKIAGVILGYEQYAQLKGGYPNGYLDAAGRAGILKKINNDGILTKGELFSVIYNMLFAYKVDINSLSYDDNGEKSISFKEGNMLLSEAYSLKAYRGQIYATDFASIFGDTAPTEDSVVIGGSVYKALCGISLNDVGKTVDFYLTDENEVYAAVERENTVYEISGSDICNDTTTRVVSYDEGEKNKTLSVAGNAFYMYNASPVTAPTDAMMKPSYGKLELLDNDNDRVIDVVKIWDYKSYYIKSVAQDKFFVSENSYGSTYIKYKNNGKNVKIFDRNMNRLDESRIIAGKVVTVAENSDTLILILSDDVFYGTLESLHSDGNVIIEGLEYEYLPSFEYEKAFGKRLKYYIDINETIVYANTADEIDYAILYGVEKAEGFDETVRIKLYYKGYFDIYECDEKVYLSMDGGATFEKVSCTELYGKFVDSSAAAIKKQLIKYETYNNKIKRIIAANTTKTDINEDEFRRNLAPSSAIQWNMGTRQVMYRADAPDINYMWSNNGTFVYLVSDDEDKCTYSSMNDLYGGHYAVYKDNAQKYYNVSGYDLTELGYFKYIVVEVGGTGVNAAPSVSSPLALVTGRKTILDTDSTPVDVVTAYTNEHHARTIPSVNNLIPKSADLKNVERANHTKYPAGTIKFSDLKPGDIIQFVKDAFSGRITSFTVLSRGEDISKDYCSTANGFTSNAWDSVITGTVSVKDDYGVRISGPAISHSVYGNSVPVMMDTTIDTAESFDKVYRYNTSTEGFELVTANDIYEGARVWCFVEDKYFQYGVIFVIVE